jgi:succinate dehydrogenase / fumarate reductase membrane anchor subunit
MSFRTPLSTARGLGSAKHGVGHWISERVAAVALVPLVIWAVYSVILLAQLDYYGAVEWIGSPVNATLMILTIAISFMHMQSGLRVVIEDYVYSHLGKAACLLANLFVSGLAGALAIMSILKVALGGA